jgi:LacI family transcriptional regulator
MSTKDREDEGRAVGIKDIARELGVSTGTVDRALHGKPGINAETRARVLKQAKAMGYRPNLAARYLKSRKVTRIAVQLPREIALFWDSLREGIREAAAPFSPALQVDFHTYRNLGDGDVPLFEQALAEGTGGFIIAPGDPAALAPALARAAERDIPVICVVTDAPESTRLTSVSADPVTVGALAGELLGRFLPSGGKIAFFTGWLGTQDHADKLKGFDASLRAADTSFSIAATVEAHDDAREASRRAREVLHAHPDLAGIYVSTVNSLPVLEALDAHRPHRPITVITTDLFPELVARIRSGQVAATVYQRPLTQGRTALRAMQQYLMDGTKPEPRLKVVPHLVMRSNLDLLLERLGAADLAG